MKWIQFIAASLLIVSLSSAEEPKKLLKPDTVKQTKQTQKSLKKPAWMLQDNFILETIDGKRISLLSTKKGFSFKGNENKLTLLVVWTTECKSCGKWLEELNTLQKAYPQKVAVIGLEIGNTQKKKLEKLVKEKKADAKAIKKIIEANHATLKKYAKAHHLSFPIVSTLSNEGNLAFTMQTLYKFQFDKPRGKAKRGGALPFTIVFGYQGQTAGITAGVADPKAYRDYIEKLIKYYDEKK